MGLSNTRIHPDLTIFVPHRGKSRKQRSHQVASSSRAGEKVLSKPVLALQGLASIPRAQLLAVSLLALENQLSDLEENLVGYAP